LAPGIADPAWPNQPKAHLMVTYLRETYKNNRDLEKCSMKKDENPKVLLRR
jgi:hypothetical protein